MKKNLFNSTLALFAALGMMFAGFSASNNNLAQDSSVCKQNVQIEAGWLGKTFDKAVNSVEKHVVNHVKKDVKNAANSVKEHVVGPVKDAKNAANSVKKGIKRIFH